MKTKNKEKGFTLVELMVVIAITSIIAYGMFAAVRSGHDQIRTGELKMTIQNAAREGLYKMTQELRQSAPNRVTLVPGGANTIRFNIPDPNNPVDGNYNVNWGGSHDIQYTLGGLNNQQLIRTRLDLAPPVTTVLANDVVTLNFTGNGTPPSVITATIGVQRTLVNGRLVPALPLQMTARAEMRNS